MSSTDEVSRPLLIAPPPGRGSEAAIESDLLAQEITAAVKQAEPRVLFVEQRILRRVILQDCHLSGIGFQVPHGQVYTIERERLLVIVERSELGISPAADLPHQVILLPHPGEDRPLAADQHDFLLWQAWRDVFHGRVHAELQERLARGDLTEPQILEWIGTIGASPFFEVRQVLRRDDLLRQSGGAVAAFVEFAAVVLELRYFAPGERPYYFPAIESWRDIDASFDAAFDHAAWHAQTRPRGAPDVCPEVTHVPRPPVPADSDVAVRPPAAIPLELWRFRVMQASRLGNHVQAAILAARAGDLGIAEEELGRLAARLARLCGGEPDEWRSALCAMLAFAASGYRSVEVRMLYDLQKACVAQEQGVFRFDFWRWLGSWGQSPLRKPLPILEEVLVAKNVRAAAHRLPYARLHVADRERLTQLLKHAEEQTEEALRTRLRPLVIHDLEAAGLVPANLPEQTARDKLVEQLLDHIAERGFLNMGNLRDALSQNQLKLPDLGGVYELLLGDKLLRADRRLAESLDGVYRAGAVYLRTPQRLSSIAFGTPTGRFLVQYLVLPFGGAYVVLEALKHIAHAVGIGDGHAVEHGSHATQRSAHEVVVARVSRAAAKAGRMDEPGWFDNALDLLSRIRLFDVSVVVCGIFFLLLYHRPEFRRQVVAGLLTCWRWSRWLLVDLPLRIVRAPWVQWVLQSQAFAVFRSYALRPAVATTLVLAPPALTWHSLWSPRLWLDVFLGLNVFLNSPWGRYLEERVLDIVVRTWHELRFRILTVMFHWIMEAFQRLMQGLEQVIYVVDEWLRFRAGDPRQFIAVKLVIGLIWGVVSYVIRFAVTLLIEPQVNPIKHFPVVTVSHKLLLPYTLWMKYQFAQLLGPGHDALATTLATTLILLVPGMIGFLVWELKENWRLYATNRPPHLEPVVIGHHGETLSRLLRPGFHSGTLPRLFARLRRSLHADPQDAHNLASYKHVAEIEEVGVTIRRFVDRELCRLVALSGFDPERRLQVGEVRLATQRVELTLESTRHGDAPAILVFEDRGGLLAGSLVEPGWLLQLPAADHRRVFYALRGLFHLGGCELLGHELEQRLPRNSLWESTREELLVSTTAGRLARYRVDGVEGAWLQPCDPAGHPDPSWPPLPAEAILNTRRPIRWDEWVDHWRSLTAPPQQS